MNVAESCSMSGENAKKRSIVVYDSVSGFTKQYAQCEKTKVC